MSHRLSMPCSVSQHPSLQDFYKTVQKNDQGRLVSGNRELPRVCSGPLASYSSDYASAQKMAEKPLINEVGQGFIRQDIKQTMADRKVSVLDETLSLALNPKREMCFGHLNFHHNFSPFEYKDAVAFESGWIGTERAYDNYEYLEKWASNIHRLLLDGQEKEVYSRIKAGLENVLDSTTEPPKGQSERLSYRAALFVCFVGDVLRSVPQLDVYEKTGFLFIQSLLDELASRSDIDQAMVAAVADIFVQKLERTQEGALLPYIKVSDLESLDEKIASAHHYASAREFKTSWIPKQKSDYSSFFASDSTLLQYPVKEWLDNTRRLLRNKDYTGFQQRLQQAVDAVYTEAESLSFSTKGAAITPAEVIRHPLWKAFRRFILAAFPEGKHYETEKRASHSSVKVMQPNLNRSQLSAAIANVQDERAQLEQLLLVAKELEARGVAHEGEIGLLQLTTMEELLKVVKIGYQVRTTPLWEQLGEDDIDGSTTELKADTEVGANELEFGYHASASALVRALADIPVHYEGDIGEEGHYTVDASFFAESAVKAEAQAVTGAGVKGWSRTWVDSGDMAILDMLKVAVGGEVEAGVKAGGNFTFTLNDILQISGNAELWAGGKFWCEAGAYAGPGGIGFKAKSSAFAGIETKATSSTTLKSRFSHLPALQGSGTLILGAGAGFCGGAQAILGGNGEFKVGTSAYTCLGLGAGLEWSISGHSEGSKIFAQELAARAIRRFSKNAMYYEGMEQQARTTALSSRLAALQEGLGEEIEKLKQLETQLQSNLDKKHYRPDDFAVVEKIKLNLASKTAEGSSPSQTERAKVIADKLLQTALDKHYRQSPFSKNSEKRIAQLEKAWGNIERECELQETELRRDELQQAMIKITR